MKLRAWRPLILLTLFGAFAGACSSSNPTGAPNREPVVLSVTVSPESIGPSDSAVVTCTATDPDGDVLVYDWDTDVNLRIRGVPADYPVKTGTTNNAEWFYPNDVPTSVDSAWVIVTARDGRGGTAFGGVNFFVKP